MKHSHKILAPIIILILLLSALPVQTAHAFVPTYTVNSSADTDDGSCDLPSATTDCTLREAINVAVAAKLINFDPSMSGQTILVTSSLTISSQDITIDGSSLSSHVKISGGGDGGVRVFYISDSTVTINEVDIIGGYCKDCYGGAMRIFSGTVDITNSMLVENKAISDGGVSGGAIDNHGTLNITGCTFHRNSTTGDGGAIYINTAASTTITNSTFSENESADFGGAIYNRYGYLEITNSTFKDNEAVKGGGISNSTDGTLVISGSIFDNNDAVSETSTTYGGGIYNATSSATATISNSTFANNDANTNAITANGSGGAIWNSGTLTLVNSTFSKNGAKSAGGLSAGGTITMKNTILANSTSGDDCRSGSGPSPFIANVNNLIENNAASPYNCAAPISSADPKLAPLADNGGPTQTMRLQPGSPAINAGNDAVCAAVPVDNKDQRGVTRPYGAHCDIGAYELKTGRKTFKSQGKYDGWVLESGEYTEKGGTKNNLGTVLQVGDDSADRQYRAILSFGTAGLPDTAVITKVILKVKKAGVTGTNPINTHNGLVVDIKKGKFSTKPALQIQDFQAKANKLKAGKFPKKLYSGWHKSVLYAASYPYINLKGRTQIRLRFTLGDNDDLGADILMLYSGNAVKAKRPQLIVEYYVP